MPGPQRTYRGSAATERKSESDFASRVGRGHRCGRTRTSVALPLVEPDVRISRIRLSSRTPFPSDMHPACSAGLGLTAQLLSRLPMDSTAVAASSVLGLRQSALVASDSACSQPRPLRSTVVTRFVATTGLSDSPAATPRLMDSSRRVPCLCTARHRGLPSSRSLVLRLCPHALTPFTPGKARTRSSPLRPPAGFALSEGLAFPTSCNEAVSSSRFPISARAFTFPGFSPRGCPR
jgi:hypothetical protein